jgi:hypothetical protein
VLCVLGYVALAWAVRFDLPQGDQIASLVYPLDTFSMYAQAPSPRMSTMLIRDAEGAVHSVTEFRSFDCKEPTAGETAACADRTPIQYLRDDALRHIESHRGPGSDEVELIVRSWELRSGAPVRFDSDCIVARCRVSR